MGRGETASTQVLLIRELAGGEGFSLIGEMDLSGEQALKAALEVRVATGGDLTLDLSQCTFMDSTGLRLLVAAASQLEGRASLIIRSPSAAVRKLIELTGVDRLSNLIVDDPTAS
jgi:anti-anti-sigma factor